jgi:hypothetical protein
MTEPPDTQTPDNDPTDEQSKPEEPKYYGMTKRGHIITAIVFTAVFLCCIGAIQGWWAESDPEPQPLIEQAKSVCYDAVLSQIKAPSTAELAEIGAYPEEGDQWIVNGTFDAQNSFGAMLRSEFTCSLHQSGDVWLLDSVVIL